jgi:hypothetical protein
MLNHSKMKISLPPVRELIIKRYKRWNRKINISKRQQMVIVTVILTVGLILTQTVSLDYRFPLFFLMSIFAYLLTAFCLRDDLQKIEWITLLTLPTLYTSSILIFYFILPGRWIVRIPVAILYAIGMYALLLTENIYNIAANRTIALLRAAHTVGFVITLLTYYFLVQTIISMHLNVIFNCLTVFIISFLLLVQSLWAVMLENKISQSILIISLICAMAITQIVWMMSFWPINLTIGSLFLTTCFYSFLGLGQQFLLQKLYQKTFWEFLTVIAIVFSVLVLTTNWY